MSLLRLLPILFVLLAAAGAQTRYYPTVQSGAVADRPATCTAYRQFYINTDSSPDTMQICVDGNQWQNIGDGTTSGQMEVVSDLGDPSLEGGEKYLDTGLKGPYFDSGSMWSLQRGCISVTDYGAVGDDDVDDTDAFQSALNALMADPGGMTNCLSGPQGVYKITRQLWYEGNNGVALGFVCTARRSRNIGGCILKWYGPKGGTMFFGLGMSGSEMDGWQFWANGGATPAQNGIWIMSSLAQPSTTTHNISSIVRGSDGIVTVTTTEPHDFIASRVAKIEGVTGDTTFNGVFPVLYSDSDTTFAYVQGGTAGSGTVAGATAKNYRSSGATTNYLSDIGVNNWQSPTSTITAISSSGTGAPGSVSVTTSTAHYLIPGDNALVSGVTTDALNGSYLVNTVTSSTTATLTPLLITGTNPGAVSDSDGTLQAGSSGILWGSSPVSATTVQVDLMHMSNLRLNSSADGTAMSAVKWLQGGNTKVAFIDKANFSGMKYGLSGPLTSGILEVTGLQGGLYGSTDKRFTGAWFMEVSGTISVKGFQSEDFAGTRIFSSSCFSCQFDLIGGSFQSQTPTDDVIIATYGSVGIRSSNLQNNRDPGVSLPYIQMFSLGNIQSPSSLQSSTLVSEGNYYHNVDGGSYIPVKDASGNVFMASGQIGYVNATNITSLNDKGGDSGTSNAGRLPLKNTVALNGALQLGERLHIRGIITPAQITSNQNDYAPTDATSGATCDTATVIRMSTDALRSVTGLNCGNASDTSGATKLLLNAGSTDIHFPGESASSTAANRFAAGFMLAPKDSRWIWYDNNLDRWVEVGSTVTVRDGSSSDLGLKWASQPNTGWYRTTSVPSGSSSLVFQYGGTDTFRITSGYLHLGDSWLTFGSSTLSESSIGFKRTHTGAVALWDDSASPVGDVPRMLSIYQTGYDGTFTNYERINVGWGGVYGAGTSNVAYVNTVSGGTGTARALRIGVSGGGTELWEFGTNFHFYPVGHNLYDFGGSSNRVREIWSGSHGISFLASDSNPTCSSGVYQIYADLSEAKLKKCQNGTVSDVSSPDPTFATLTDGATITWSIGSVPTANSTVTLGGNRTLNVTGLVNGGSYLLKIVQDATGSRELTLGTGCTWKISGGGEGSIIGQMSTSANAIDIFSFTYDGTNCYGTLATNFN